MVTWIDVYDTTVIVAFIGIVGLAVIRAYQWWNDDRFMRAARVADRRIRAANNRFVVDQGGMLVRRPDADVWIWTVFPEGTVGNPTDPSPLPRRLISDAIRQQMREEAARMWAEGDMQR